MLLACLCVLVSFCVSYLTRRLAFRTHAIDEVRGGRKIHTQATPLLGGVGIGLSILIGLAVAWYFRLLPFDGALQLRLLGFILAICVLMVGGFIDDRFDLPPWIQVIFPIGAALAVMATGTSILEISKLHGAGIMRLDWWHADWIVLGRVLSFVFPADILTLGWLLGVTYATKAMDGLDGLVTGHTVIGAALILLLASSPLFYQPTVMILAWIVLGSFLGFLPVNLHPAKQFLGEAGSTLAGFSLGFLAIVSGAKVATAFMALGIPLVDFLLVILLRLRAGRSPFQGDDSHLHFRLLRLGFSQRQVAALFWMLAVVFGLFALGLQTQGKAILMVGVICLTALLSYGAATLQPLSSFMKKRLFFVACAITLGVSVWAVAGLWRDRVQKSATVQSIVLHERTLVLEIADTVSERTQGLSDRAYMRTDHGMLFVFPRAQVYPFWMPRMQFDLDIIWLNGDEVVDIQRLSAQRSASEEPARYTPKVAADRVLELVAGQASVYGLKIGDRVPELQIGVASDKY